MAERFLARLTNLDHTALLAYAADLSAAHRHTADKFLVNHSPLPDWARDDVLLSTDLLPKVFASLKLEDGAAASVCHAWKEAWVATNDGRRGLRPIEVGKPDFEVTQSLMLAELPDGNAAVCCYGGDVRIVDSNLKAMKHLPHIGVPTEYVILAASDAELFAVHGHTMLRRYDLDGFAMTHEYDLSTLMAEDEYRFDGFDNLVLAQGNLLFATAVRDDLPGKDEIVCFDARNLAVLKRFGRGRFSKSACGMAVVGSELLVCNKGSHCIDVFSLAGAYLRSIRGDFREPMKLQHYDGRLYVVESFHGRGRRLDEDDSLSEEQKKVLKEVMGRRILVTTLEGETLQEWKLPPQVSVEAKDEDEDEDEGGPIQESGPIVDIFIYGRVLLVNRHLNMYSEECQLQALQGI